MKLSNLSQANNNQLVQYIEISFSKEEKVDTVDLEGDRAVVGDSPDRHHIVDMVEPVHTVNTEALEVLHIVEADSRPVLGVLVVDRVVRRRELHRKLHRKLLPEHMPVPPVVGRMSGTEPDVRIRDCMVVGGGRLGWGDRARNRERADRQ